MRTLRSHRGLYGVLDVGSSKITCLVVNATNPRNPKILGMGHRASRGMRAGEIVDMDAAQEAILATVTDAEDAAGLTIEDVFVSYSGGKPRSQLIDLEIEVDGKAVLDSHVSALVSYAAQELPFEQKSVRPMHRLHTLPVDYRVDRNHGVSDPRGMSADRLGSRLLAISVARSSLDNVIDAIDKCHLTIRGVMVGGLASHYAVVTEEEMQLGACLVEIGASISTLVIFHGGGAVHLETLPIGSDHLTRDLAAALNCNIAAAERIKTLYGSALSNPSDSDREIRLPQEALNGGLVGSDRITRSFVVGIMQPRLDEMLTMLKQRMEHQNLRKFAGRRVIFTGGGANLTGLRDYATLALERQIRIGRPREMQGLPASRSGFELSAALGLAHFTATAGQKSAASSLGAAPLHQKSLLEHIPLVGGLFTKRAA